MLFLFGNIVNMLFFMVYLVVLFFIDFYLFRLLLLNNMIVFDGMLLVGELMVFGIGFYILVFCVCCQGLRVCFCVIVKFVVFNIYRVSVFFIDQFKCIIKVLLFFSV